MFPFAKQFSLRRTPQSEPIPRTVPNAAGGHAFPVDDWTRLARFLVLGSEGGSFYAGERALTRDNAAAVLRCLAADGARAVAAIVAVSEGGRAPKPDPAIFALALAAGAESLETRRAALAALPRVCRTGTHLFQFAASVEASRGWGRSLRRAVGRWYLDRPVDAAAFQAVKVRNRAGWTHRDLLRLAHPETDEPARKALFDWICRGTLAAEAPALVHAFAAAQAPGLDPEGAAALVRAHRLPWEALPTGLLASRVVNEALLEGMPVGALVRQLGRLTAAGVVAPFSPGTAHVVAVLSDRERLLKARLHPMALLVALKTYASGRGVLGRLAWEPVAAVVEALNAAFYTAFRAVEPTGRRLVLALDVSGSMASGRVAGSGLTPREAAAAMALVTAATEERWQVVGFTGGEAGLTPLPLGPSLRLDAAVAATAGLPFGSTDCALPMRWALARGIQADAFVVYTDSETWAGPVHPVQALREYREKTGIPAKLVVVGLVSNGFSIADPDDAGMLDVVGFDAAAPAVIADFLRA
ncbi:TROVE domain-containing protein [Methylobacterium nonmethylotrophicum]|uniref:TROVE domain-containing protein n=1 Tax=Methylobacterium nonmethylotrophicum TaxID=1141884 RepID=A0A4Z0NQR8_9HYPH|nr:TROVE domain-containing protein [Methylobacterium nonmethylotrophicum]TGD99099.1 TROVE domain-containing protein [Methylobacterium nonmethylotrophicum]